MINWSALGAGGKALVGVGLAGVIGVSGYFISQASQSPTADVTNAAVPEVTAAPAEPAVAEAAAVAQPTTQVVLPKFDLVRIDAQGNTTVAGSAAPDQTLSFRIDGAEIAQAVADQQGNFAALFTLTPNPNPRLLTLVAMGPEGQEFVAENSVAISPIAEPAPVIEAAVETPVEPVASADAVTVAEPAAVAEAPVALIIGADGVEEIVNDAAAAQPAAASMGVTIAAITYSANGGVVLSGIGAVNAPLRLYLDQASVAETAVQGDGNWSVELADIAPGLYTLRVDQLNAEGQVEARFETPFKRETQQTLAAATTAVEPAVQAPTDAVAVVVEEAVAAVAEPAAVPEPAVEAASAPAEVATATTEVAAPKATEIAIVGEAAAPEVKVEPAAVAASAPITITVQPGFTLWRIAQDQLGQGIMYVQVFEANQGNIADPDLIYPGQIFTIPKPAE